MRVTIILYDLDQKCPVQQAFVAPEGMSFSDAEDKIKAVVAKDRDNYIDNVIAAGFELADWGALDMEDCETPA